MTNRYLTVDPWKIIEEHYDPKHVKASESIFSLGNGAMGQRANFEEHYSGPTFQGSYVAGVYYPDKTRVGWWKNGYPKYFAKVLNAPNWIGIDIAVNGQRLDLNKQNVLSFKRVLNMKTGIYTRTATVAFEDGTQIAIEVERFLMMGKREAGAIKYAITPINGKVSLQWMPYVDGNVTNEDSNWDDPFWKHMNHKMLGAFAALKSQTFKSAFEIVTYMQTQLLLNDKPIKQQLQNTKKASCLTQSYTLECGQNETATLIKFGGYLSDQYYAKDALLEESEKIAQKLTAKGWDVLRREQEMAWDMLWQTSDIEIEGDQAAQQAIRFNIFQLNQTYSGEDPRLNIGPKGFTGEKYGGSTYWDTEAYCLPFYMATKSSDVARNLLKYRYNHLQAAQQNAAMLGFTNGAALYPMVTMNGEECHNEWEITFEEIHRNGAIAFAIYNYVRFTKDTTYIPEMGLEVLIGIARFWALRVSYSERLQQFVILGVTGPNEYENNVNNNWYTNYIASWCLKYAAQQSRDVQTNHPEDYIRIKEKTQLNTDELIQWQSIADTMYFPYDERHQIFLQQDGFLDKELKSVDHLKDNERPINQHWSWDRVLRSPYIKQADVLQGFYFFEDQFSLEELKKHYEFYEPFTVHESSLSPCVHAILASKLDKMDDAYRFYLRTSRLDLDDYNKEVHEGLHITSMAGTWMSIVEGFGGLRIENGLLSLNPKLPENWSSFSFKINYQGAPLKVHVSRSATTLTWFGDHDLKVLLNGQLKSLLAHEAA